jgi:DNA-binding transcriptional regulator YdaS (Cro superfamily)
MPPDSEPVVSALDAQWFQPERSPRRYRIAPLSYRQRNAMQRDIRRTGGPEIDRAVMIDVLRHALRELAPENLAELLATVDAAEATPEDRTLQAQMSVIEHAVAGVSAYDEMQEKHIRHREALVLCTLRHSLRGWDGPGLPLFLLQDGMVPDDLLDAIPAAELDAVFGQARVLHYLGPDAVGNSEAPSPSPASPAPTPEG